MHEPTFPPGLNVLNIPPKFHIHIRCNSNYCAIMILLIPETLYYKLYYHLPTSTVDSSPNPK